MNSWKEYKLRDFVIKIIDNRGKNPIYSPNGHDVIETSCISGTNKYPNYSVVKKYVSQDCYNHWFRAGHPQKDDIIIITVGNSIGNVCIMNCNRGVLTQNLIGLRLNKDLINSDYVYYYLSLSTIQDYLKGLDIGSAQPSIKVPHLLNTVIPKPPLVEQHAIASGLSNLDNKIELLHRQNKTLEGIAEALWHKMFVEEADPGWKKGKLGDLIELCYGKGLKEEKRMPGRYPVLGSSGIVGYHNDFIVKGPGIVIGRKGTLGVVNYVEEDFFPIDTTYFIKSKTNAGKLFFEYFLLKEFSFEEMNSDSAVPGLNREIAESMEFIVPEIDSIYKYNDSCEPLFSKKMKNENQIRTLSSLRDTLLKKLMSGEVRVRP
jgi:type I restriction enzyme S subunit